MFSARRVSRLSRQTDIALVQQTSPSSKGSRTIVDVDHAVREETMALGQRMALVSASRHSQLPDRSPSSYFCGLHGPSRPAVPARNNNNRPSIWRLLASSRAETGHACWKRDWPTDQERWSFSIRPFLGITELDRQIGLGSCRATSFFGSWIHRHRSCIWEAPPVRNARAWPSSSELPRAKRGQQRLSRWPSHRAFSMISATIKLTHQGRTPYALSLTSMA